MKREAELTGSRSEFEKEAAGLLERAYSIAGDEDAKALYRDWARTYDRTMLDGLGYITPRETASLLSRHVADRNAAILDVGSGTGLAGAELAARGFMTLDALDYSPEMLAVAGFREVYRTLIEADLNGPLGIADESYDAMICTGTFTHAHVGAACLHELFRILRPGGMFACTVHKDVWHPSGFAQVTQGMIAQGVVSVVHRAEGAYYKDSTQPEGWYIVWKKT